MREKIKIHVSILLIIMMITFIILSFSNNAFVKAADETTGAVDYTRTKQLQYPTITDLLPSSQRDGEYIFIPRENLKNLASILCSWKGRRLPEKEATLVKSGGKQSYRIDGENGPRTGKLTGYLTMNDKGSTVFRGEVKSSGKNPFSNTDSRTYGRFKVVDTYKATPAEAWVLTEMDMNDPAKYQNAFKMKSPQEVYARITDENRAQLEEDIEKPEFEYKGNITVWAVEWSDKEHDEPTKYVLKQDNAYYVAVSESGETYQYPLYVQHAWWKVKEAGITADEDAAKGINETALAHEAEAYEEYIKRIAIFQNDKVTRKASDGTSKTTEVTLKNNWQWNDDYTTKVDYKNYIPLDSKDGKKRQMGFDASKYEVRFNNETNKYVVGPFTLNYLRAGTKQGIRDKVDFSGISQSTLYGLDADGNRLVDKNGKNLLELGKNYRFIYNHDHEAYIPTITSYVNGKANQVKLDVGDEYPYPYDNEEFYIEIDYLNDMVSLESLNFDFQYLNSGAVFEYLEGNYLIIHWTPYEEYLGDSTGNGGISMVNTVTLGSVDLSSRAEGSGSTIIDCPAVEMHPVEKSSNWHSVVRIDGDEGSNLKLYVPELNESELKGEIEYYIDSGEHSDSIGMRRWRIDFESCTIKYNYTTPGKVGGDTIVLEKNEREFTIPREYDSPEEQLQISYKIVYSRKEYDHNRGYYIDEGERHSLKGEGKLNYNNDILKQQIHFEGYSEFEPGELGPELRHRGVVTDDNLKVGLGALLNEKVGDRINYGTIEIEVLDEDCKFVTQDNTMVVTPTLFPRNRRYKVVIRTKSLVTDSYIEENYMYITMRPMYISTPGNKTGECSGLPQGVSGAFSVYNIYKDLELVGPESKPDDTSWLYIPTAGLPTFLSTGYFSYVSSPSVLESLKPGESRSGSVKYTYRDKMNTHITITVSGTIHSPDKIKEEDKEVSEQVAKSKENNTTNNNVNENENGNGSGNGSGNGNGNGSGSGSGSGNSSSEGNSGTSSSVDTSRVNELIKKYQEELTTLRKQLDEYKKELDQLQPSTSEDLLKQYNELMNRLNEINNELSQYTQRRNELNDLISSETNQEKLKSYKVELEKVKSTIAKLESEQVDVTSKIENIVLQYNNLAELIKINNEIIELQKQKEEAQSKVDDVSERLSNINTQIGENENSREENATNENQGTSDNTGESKKETNRQQLNTQHDTVLDEKHKYDESLSNVENQIQQKLKRQRELLQEVKETLNQKVYEAEKKIVETETRIQLVEKYIADLQSLLKSNNSGNASTSRNGKTTTVGASAGSKHKSGTKLYYLKFTSATEKPAQRLIQGRDATIKNIDAANGRIADVAGEAVYMQIFPKKIDLRTNLGGVVWIDEEPQKGNDSKEFGTKDKGEKPAEENSVEIIVYKVKYDITGKTPKEVSRAKAVAWIGTEDKKDGSFKLDRTLDFADGKGRLFIDKNGQYKIDKIQVPAEQGLDSKKYRMSYDIEFVYDGQEYEATELLKSTGKDTVPEKVAEFKKTVSETKGADKDYSKYANDSYVVENAKEREAFDSKFTEITGGKSITEKDGKYTTEGEAKGVDNSVTKLNYESTNVEGETVRKDTKLVEKDGKGYVDNRYRFAARTSEAGLYYSYEAFDKTSPYYHVKQNYYDNMTLAYLKQVYKPVDEYFNQVNLGLIKRYNADISVMKDLYKAKVVVDEQENDYTFNSWGELTDESLKQRVQAGYRATKYTIGLYNSDYRYRSSVYNTVEDEITKTILKAIKDDTELRLFVTYKIAITNESEFTDVSINEFKDYYDKTFTLVDKNVESYIQTSNTAEVARENKIIAHSPYYRKLKAGITDNSNLYKWNAIDDLSNENIDIKESDKESLSIGDVEFASQEIENEDFKLGVTSSLNALNGDRKSVNPDMTLEPGEKFEVFVTYEVDREGFNKIQEEKDKNSNDEKAGENVNRDNSLLGSKNNIAEISKYSTVYTQENVDRQKTTRYKAGQISGRIDRDSAPDNINISKLTDDSLYEDDTEASPVVTVELKSSDAVREINGVVWDDYRENKEDKDADGIYNKDDGDKPIENIDVTLVEKIRITPDDLEHIQEKAKENGEDRTINNLSVLDYEFEYIWPDGTFDIGTDDKNKFNSHAKTNAEGEYKFRNMVAGNYVVRFEYGNTEETKKYNGQDYKNTAYQTGMINASAEKNDAGEICKGNTDGTEIGTSESQTLQEAGIENRSTLNNQWHDLSDNEQANKLNEARVSDARDYEPRRMQVNAYSRTITNHNSEVLESANITNDYPDDYKKILEQNKAELIENTSMVANTAKIVVDIEKQSEIEYDKQVSTSEGTEEHEYTISNIDFGLVRRPETRMYIQKEIAKIELMAEDGTEKILSVSMDDEGNIIKDGEIGSKSIRIDKVIDINKEYLNGTQGFKYIKVTPEEVNGKYIELTYNIKVYNNSEEDFVSEKMAKIKNIQELYNTANEYEATNGEEAGLSPFNTGRGIVYGKYVGLNYYTNTKDAYKEADSYLSSEELKNKYNYGEYSDVVVTTTVDQLVDYIDNDISRNIEGTTGIVNQSWEDSSKPDRENKLSEVSYKDNKVSDENLQDTKGIQYIGKTKNDNVAKNNITFSQNELMTEEPSKGDEITRTKIKVNEEDGSQATRINENGNIVPETETISMEELYTTKDKGTNTEIVDMYNPELTKQLKPQETTTIKILTSEQAVGENINNMSYDNLVEIAMYSNTAGRRDTSAIPGNANMIAKDNRMEWAGYNRIHNNGEYHFIAKEQKADDGTLISKSERDAYAAKDTVTFSEPTGLSLSRERERAVIRVVIITIALVLMAGVVGIAIKMKNDKK